MHVEVATNHKDNNTISITKQITNRKNKRYICKKYKQQQQQQQQQPGTIIKTKKTNIFILLLSQMYQGGGCPSPGLVFSCVWPAFYMKYLSIYSGSLWLSLALSGSLLLSNWLTLILLTSSYCRQVSCYIRYPLTLLRQPDDGTARLMSVDGGTHIHTYTVSFVLP